MIVRVVPYDSDWSRYFELERGRIEAALGDVVVALHHIGSTAVPGLLAKPVIDILLETSNLAELDRRTPDMEALGYEAKGEFGIAGRRYYRRDDEREHHALLAERRPANEAFLYGWLANRIGSSDAR